MFRREIRIRKGKETSPKSSDIVPDLQKRIFCKTKILHGNCVLLKSSKINDLSLWNKKESGTWRKIT